MPLPASKPLASSTFSVSADCGHAGIETLKAGPPCPFATPRSAAKASARPWSRAAASSRPRTFTRSRMPSSAIRAAPRIPIFNRGRGPTSTAEPVTAACAMASWILGLRRPSAKLASAGSRSGRRSGRGAPLPGRRGTPDRLAGAGVGASVGLIAGVVAGHLRNSAPDVGVARSLEGLPGHGADGIRAGRLRQRVRRRVRPGGLDADS